MVHPEEVIIFLANENPILYDKSIKSKVNVNTLKKDVFEKIVQTLEENCNFSVSGIRIFEYNQLIATKIILNIWMDFTFIIFCRKRSWGNVELSVQKVKSRI